ncbi:MAG: hypothetical protein ACI97A_000182 [Planctomycetota bacterium]|jgi:hypothetical protein
MLVDYPLSPANQFSQGPRSSEFWSSAAKIARLKTSDDVLKVEYRDFFLRPYMNENRPLVTADHGVDSYVDQTI